MSESSPQKPGSPAPARRRRGRLLWILTALLLLSAATWLFGPTLATPIIRAKLQEMIASQLNAELRIGGLQYRFPYGVVVNDASLVTADPAGGTVELITLPRLELSLARLPFGPGPLVIRTLSLDEPSIHLIHTAGGLVGRRTLVRPIQEREAAPMKLSEMFELRRTAINNGRVVYEDRAKNGSVPLVWRGISISLLTSPAANPLYTYQFTAGSPPVATVSASGTFNIDQLDLLVDQLKMQIAADPDARETPAPAIVQDLLQRNRVRGRLQINASAHVPLKATSQSRFNATLRLSDAQASPPDFPQALDQLSLVVRCSTSPLTSAGTTTAPAATALATAPTTSPSPTTLPGVPPALYVAIDKADLLSRDTQASIRPLIFTLKLDGRDWQLDRTTAQIVFGGDLPGTATKPATSPLGPFRGTVVVDAYGRGPLDHDSDASDPTVWDLRVRSATLAVSARPWQVNDLYCHLRLSRGAIDLIGESGAAEGLRMNAFGGSVRASAHIQPSPLRYSGRIDVRGVGLKEAVAAFSASGQPPQGISGRATAWLQFTSADARQSAAPLDLLSGTGEIEVVEGDFYRLPMLSSALDTIAPTRDAATVGQAAGIYKVQDRTVRFEKLAVSSPLVGVHGGGQLGFDGNLDFIFVAAPLSDWKKKLKEKNIPIIGDVAADLAGGLQKLLSSAAGKLLYQVRISGSLDEPKVNVEPAPLLTEGAAKVFSGMLKGGEDLLEQIRGK